MKTFVRAQTKWGVAIAAAATAAAVGCGTGASSQAPAAVASSVSYSLTVTKRCLQQRKVRVAAVPRTDAQKQAFRDLAQRTSIEASIGSARVDLAFTRSNADANVLAELLRPPQGPYVVRVVKNVVVMHRVRGQTAAAKVLRCLR